ncbi:hypothetical protein TNCV_3688741 [Trichonephila clavipes]|nr:hypothetical protein TNCV_3688741 [Trichonephila clavipes]
MKEGLIALNYECSKCNERMGLYERKSAVLDGDFEWSFQGREKRFHATPERRLRQGSKDMLDRSHDMLDRSHDMLDRSHDMLDRSNDMLDRSNDMLDRSNEMTQK